MTISTTRTRRADGTWGGWTTTVTEPAAPVASPVTYELRTTRTTAPVGAPVRTADHRGTGAGLHPSLLAHVDQVRAQRTTEDTVTLPCSCPPGTHCRCTAHSTD